MERCLIGWSVCGTDPPWISAEPQPQPHRKVTWPDLVGALERGEALFLDERALLRAHAAARAAGLHLRPQPVNPPAGRAGAWFRLAAYDHV